MTITKKGDIYTITKNYIFFTTTKRYKDSGYVSRRFSHIKVFYKENGEFLSFLSKECKKLNAFEHRF